MPRSVKEKIEKLKQQSGLLFNSRFLKPLSTLERYEFLQLCHRRKYHEGEYIYYQNDPGTGIYFIESGRIQLIVGRQNLNDEEGGLTYDLSPPESFGSLSLGYDLRRLSSARCLSDAVLLGFFKPDFVTLKKRHPKIAVKFLETLSEISMKQLEVTTHKLIEETDLQTAFSIHFSTYYSDEEQENV